MSLRITAKQEFAEKLFYEKVLCDWRDSIDDRNRRYIIDKALKGLKSYPANVKGFTDLRKIAGIGENIATRLDASWKLFLQQIPEPRVRDVKEIKRGNALPYLTNAFVSKGQNRVPFIDKDTLKELSGDTETTKKKSSGRKSDKNQASEEFGSENDSGKNPRSNYSKEVSGNEKRKRSYGKKNSEKKSSNENMDEDIQLFEEFRSFQHEYNGEKRPDGDSQPSRNYCFLEDNDHDPQNTSMSQPVALPSYVAERPIAGLKDQRKTNPKQNSQGSDATYLSYDPVDYDKSELILVVDGRELGLKRKNSTIVDHLQKLEVKFETRPLSVGDYLWIIKLPSGEELTLDYVVERKTWDDLKASIRQARYHEQKQRLKKSGIRNVIVIAEGGEAVDRSLEQALASTSVEYKFFIQRTQHLYGTAKFLTSVTKRLKERILTEQVSPFIRKGQTSH